MRKKSLSFKLYFSYAITMLVPLLLIGFFATKNNKENNLTLLKSMTETSLTDLNTKTSQIESFLQSTKEDFEILASSPSTHGVIRALDNPNGIDVKTNSTLPQWIQRFLTTSKGFLQNKPHLHQVVYVDSDGTELVRIKKENGKVVEVPFDDLLEERNDPFIRQALSSSASDKMLSSPMHLFKESGKILEPHFPVIRLAKTVFNSSRVPKGVLAIYVDASHFLRWLDTKKSAGISYYLVNSDGFFLKHKDTGNEWGFEFENRKDKKSEVLFKESIATVYKNDLQKNSLQGFSKDFLLNYSKVQNNSNSWILVKETSRGLLNQQVAGFQQTFSIISLISIALVIILSFFMTRMITSPIISVIETLSTASKNASLVSRDISSASQEISATAQEQSSATVETTATLNEISSTVASNLKRADQSSIQASNCHEISVEGQEETKRMSEAISKIRQSVQNVIEQVNSSNDELTEIVAVIDQISAQTQVINDIVFQTKLLSFNASVEAARAGEHGKGFAVVAEEIGNLATLSGKSAEEIKELLSNSTNKVQSIVETTKTRVSSLVNDTNKEVELGEKISDKCSNSLKEVVDISSQLNDLIAEVNAASREQNEGIENITVALNSLSTGTHTSVSIARQASEHSLTLTKQAERLEEVLSTLRSEIFGSAHNKNAEIVSLNRPRLSSRLSEIKEKLKKAA